MRRTPNMHTQITHLGACVAVGAAIAAKVGVGGHRADAGGRLAPLGPGCLPHAASSLSAGPLARCGCSWRLHSARSAVQYLLYLHLFLPMDEQLLGC